MILPGRGEDYGIVRAASAFIACFLALYFADSCTRLFVNHALVFDNIFYGGLELTVSFVVALITTFVLLNHFRGWLFVALWTFAGICMIVCETFFRVNGTPLNTFQVSLLLLAHGAAADAARQFFTVLTQTSLMICSILAAAAVSIYILNWRPGKRTLAISAFACLLSLSMLEIRFADELFVPSPVGLPALVTRVLRNNAFVERGEVALELGDVPSPPLRPIKHLIVIVDETIRADQLLLDDPTNDTIPHLKSRSDVFSFGTSVSASNCSIQTQYILRTGVTPEELPDIERRTVSKPNIFAFAHRAGRKAFFIDAQSPGYSGYMSRHDFRHVQAEFGVFKPLSECPDHGECALVDRIHGIFSEDVPTFTYIIKNAAHWPFAARYPESQRVFLPIDDRFEDSIGTLNNYRNAIRWNVDLFFEALFAESGVRDYLIVYTGDHGEDLSVNTSLPPHCGHHSTVRAIEGLVPILVFTDDADLQEHLRDLAVKKRDRVSQFDLFPTWLTLFGYDRAQVLKTYGPSIFDEGRRPLAFYWGDPFSRYGGFSVLQ